MNCGIEAVKAVCIRIGDEKLVKGSGRKSYREWYVGLREDFTYRMYGGKIGAKYGDWNIKGKTVIQSEVQWLSCFEAIGELQIVFFTLYQDTVYLSIRAKDML